MTRIDEAPGGASEDEVERIEQALAGGRLPEDYRRFLLTHNGGSPEPAGFVLAGPPGPYQDSEVQWFLGIGDPDYDLEDWFATYRGPEARMPAELLPIAVDPGGNVICLAVAGERRGAVFFWDHEEESDPPGWSNVHPIADSFDAFLEGLRDLAG
jgi:hypothetical protein